MSEEKNELEENKINVSFKNTKIEQDLKKWIIDNSVIIGKSNFIKQILYKEMIKEKATE